MHNQYFSQMKQDLRFWLYMLLGMSVAVHAMYISMVGVPNTMLQSADLSVHAVFGLFGFHFGVAAMVVDVGRLFRPSFKSTLICALIGVLGYGYVLLIEGSVTPDPTWNSLVLLAGFGFRRALVFLMALKNRIFLGKKVSDDNLIFIQICAVVTLLSMSTGLALEVTKVLFPATFDYHAYRIDAAFNGLAIWCAQATDLGSPLLKTATFVNYSILVLWFYVALGLCIREGRVKQLNLWRTFIVPFMLAWFCYAAVPVSGPIYAFFDGRFPHNLPPISEVVAAKVVLPPFARNGMPSFHLTGAILVWMLTASLRNKIAFVFGSVIVAGTVWATMGLGEHYALDLVVAFPFALSLGWTLINPDKVIFNDARLAFVVGLGWVTFLAWMGLLIAAPVWLAENLLFVRLLSAWGSLVAVVLAWLYLRKVWNLPDLSTQMSFGVASPVEAAPNQPSRTPGWIIGLFLASGLAGLVYEVVYAKALALTFGSTSLAAYTVLTVYMGGMALGAWLGGLVADRTNRPLFLYAICEVLIGVYAVLTPSLFKLIQWSYVQISADVALESGALTWVRVALGASALLLPTLLMGATLPLMFKFVSTYGVRSRSAIANLYSANVFGAAFGSLVAGYAILPALGRNGSTYVAAVLSLLIGLYAIDRSKRHPLVNLERGTDDAHQPALTPVVDTPTPAMRVAGASAIAVLGVGGAVTLALEVVSMHMLSTIAGSSVYAFGLMLAAFLFGLGLGASVGERFVSNWSRQQTILFAQSGLAISIGLTAHLWDGLPGYFAAFGMSPVYLSFGAREMVRAMVCAVAMIPGAFFIGMSYSPAMAMASDWIAPNRSVKGVGLASSINTIGNISGVLIAGFWVLPLLGSRLTLQLLACVALSLALLFVGVNYILEIRRTALWKNVGIYSSVFAVMVLLTFPAKWDWNELSSGANVYFSPQKWGEVVDHAESVEGGITSVTKNTEGVFTLLTNGKFQGNNSRGGEMQAQASFALLPLLHTEKRNSALVIGYGTGMTAHVLHEQGFGFVDIAELSPDLVRMADKYFKSINHAVTSERNVKMHFADGRNYLLTQNKRYDLISIELTSIWFAGAANLYNKDFYELAKTRLSGQGVIQQWVQLHHMNRMDLVYIIGSLRSVFKYVWVYYSGGQGVIVAADSPQAIENMAAKNLLEQSLASSEYTFDVQTLTNRVVAGPSRIDALINQFDPSLSLLVSTDNNLYLEYSTPKGNAVRVDTVPGNLELLRGLGNAH